ncbi:MAG TPA: cation:proton antiporter [Burkholderiales bacterium]|nr:cation:proton antiporter [Burkholderiales bacterium]
MPAPASVDIAKHLLLTAGVILLCGIAASLLSRKIKVPDVALYLLVGVLAGPEALGAVHVSAGSVANQLLLIFGSCYILFDGGASLRLRVLKEVWITIVLLATLGVLATAAVTAVAAQWALGVPFMTALLLGAAIASTDPATLVPIFRQVRIRERVAQTVMSESAFNDATGAIMTFAVLGVAMGTGEFSISAAIADLAKQSAIGITAGAVLGYLAVLFIGHQRVGFLAEHAPVVSLMAVIASFLAADSMQASGFMAVFVFGIVVGNRDALGFRMSGNEERRLEEFVATTALLMRMFIFILLGAQVDFTLMQRYLAPGIGVVLAFMLIARPVAVLVCALPDRRAKWTLREMLFMCWTRETGVIPAALAGLLLGMHAPGADAIASVTFIAVLMTLLIQAPTTRALARSLGLLERDAA